MTVELDVQLGSRRLDRSVVYQTIAKEWSDRFGSAAPSFDATEQLEDTIGCKEEFFRCVIEDAADVQCMCFTPGPVENLQSEAGDWWLDVMIVDRTKESFLLMLVISACVARMVEQPILDEARLLLHAQQFVDYRSVFAELDKVKGKPVSEAALLIAVRYQSVLAEPD